MKTLDTNTLRIGLQAAEKIDRAHLVREHELAGGVAALGIEGEEYATMFHDWPAESLKRPAPTMEHAALATEFRAAGGEKVLGVTEAEYCAMFANTDLAADLG
jgi:hypothetical protein